MDVDLIIKTAKQEYENELFRMAVEKEKERLRNKVSIWNRIFPYRIVVININTGRKK